MLDRVRKGASIGYATFKKHTNPGARAVLLLFGGFVALFGFAILSDTVSNYYFQHLSAAQHLSRARVACGISNDQDATNCSDPDEAFRQLWAIPKSSPEYAVAADFIVSLQHQHVRLAAEAAAKSEQLRNQAFEQMQKNLDGESHDSFTCAKLDGEYANNVIRQWQSLVEGRRTLCRATSKG